MLLTPCLATNSLPLIHVGLCFLSLMYGNVAFRILGPAATLTPYYSRAWTA